MQNFIFLQRDMCESDFVPDSLRNCLTNSRTPHSFDRFIPLDRETCLFSGPDSILSLTHNFYEIEMIENRERKSPFSNKSVKLIRRVESYYNNEIRNSFVVTSLSICRHFCVEYIKDPEIAEKVSGLIFDTIDFYSMGSEGHKNLLKKHANMKNTNYVEALNNLMRDPDDEGLNSIKIFCCSYVREFGVPIEVVNKINKSINQNFIQHFIVEK